MNDTPLGADGISPVPVGVQPEPAEEDGRQGCWIEAAGHRCPDPAAHPAVPVVHPEPPKPWDSWETYRESRGRVFGPGRRNDGDWWVCGDCGVRHPAEMVGPPFPDERCRSCGGLLTGIYVVYPGQPAAPVVHSDFAEGKVNLEPGDRAAKWGAAVDVAQPFAERRIKACMALADAEVAAAVATLKGQGQAWAEAKDELRRVTKNADVQAAWVEDYKAQRNALGAQVATLEAKVAAVKALCDEIDAELIGGGVVTTPEVRALLDNEETK
jgi:hypothetical protein